MFSKIFTVVVFVIVFVTAISLLLAYPFMWMWNYAVVKAVSVANPIDYWVAFTLMIFISLFISSSSSSKTSK